MKLITRCSLLFLFILGLNACGTSDEISGMYTEIDPEGFPIEIELLEDGTGTFTYGGAQIGPDEALLWEYQDNGVYEVNYFNEEWIQLQKQNKKAHFWPFGSRTYTQKKKKKLRKKTKKKY